jgi:hypothetical protein
MVNNESEFRVKVAVRVSRLFISKEITFLIEQVRPFLQREKTHEQKSCVSIHPQTNQVILGDRKTFKYDFVFGPKIQQVNKQ